MELNTPLEDKWMKELEENARFLSLDRNSLVKKLIIDGLKRLRMKKLLPLYESGEISLEQLASQLDFSIYDTLLLLKMEKIPIGGDLAQTRQELNGLSKRLKK
jgi:hypothetical protein